MPLPSPILAAGGAFQQVWYALQNFFTAVRTYGWWQVGIELLLIGAVVYWVIKLLQKPWGRVAVGLSMVAFGMLAACFAYPQIGPRRLGRLRPCDHAQWLRESGCQSPSA